MEAPTETNIYEVNIARTVILTRDGRLLVLWRHDADDYNPGGPDLPGGGLEPGETARQTGVRETYEEAGIDLADIALREVFESVHDIPDGDRVKRLTRTFFAAYVENPVVILSDEHKDYAFVPLEEARELFAESTTKLQCLEEVVALQTRGELTAA